MRKQHTKQRRKQNQEFTIVRQSRAGLQAAENITVKLLQLKAEREKGSMLVLKMQKKREKIMNCVPDKESTFPRRCGGNMGGSPLACLQRRVRG